MTRWAAVSTGSNRNLGLVACELPATHSAMRSAVNGQHLGKPDGELGRVRRIAEYFPKAPCGCGRGLRTPSGQCRVPPGTSAIDNGSARQRPLHDEWGDSRGAVVSVTGRRLPWLKVFVQSAVRVADEHECSYPAPRSKVSCTSGRSQPCDCATPPTAYLPRCRGHFAAEMSSMRSIDTLRRKLDAVRAPRLPFTAPGADFLLGVR